MNRSIVVLSQVIVLALVPLAAAETLKIPLPGVVGHYPAVRTVTVWLPNEPLEIRGARIHLTGEAAIGILVCPGDGPSYPLPLMFNATFADTPSGLWIAYEETPDTTGPFEVSGAFVKYRDPTWEFFMDREAELTIIGGTGFHSCWEGPSPDGTVSEAVLYIDGDFRVPVEVKSWGRIKALYE